MDNKIKAPFTDAQVRAINDFQNNAFVHPFTCCSHDGCNRSEHNEGILKATSEGLICPCGKYTQNWVHSYMAKPIALKFSIPKNCNNCSKQSVCKFRDDYKKLVNDTKFFMMFDYDTNNNLLSLFEANASNCKYYETTIPIGKLTKEQFNTLSISIQHAIISEYFKHLNKDNVKFNIYSLNNTTTLRINDDIVFYSGKDELNIELFLYDIFDISVINLNSDYEIIRNKERKVYL